MKEYIEKGAACEKMPDDIYGFRDKKILRSIPAADVVEVRHGRWIEDGNYQYCSECGEEHSWVDYRAAYCDVCGAKMDGMDGGVNDAAD